jgi:hypothetical protein
VRYWRIGIAVGVLLGTVALGAGAATYRRAHPSGTAARAAVTSTAAPAASPSGRRPIPRPADGTKIRELVVGDERSCALYIDGTVVCWGPSERSVTPVPEDPAPRRVEGVTDAVALVIGDHHGCVLDSAGRVTCWGYCDLACKAGQGAVLYAKPTLLADVPPLTIMAGDGYGDTTCGVGSEDERLHCWGVMSASATWFGDPVPPHVQHYVADELTSKGRYARFAHAGAVEIMTSGVGMSCTRFRDGHTRCFSDGITDGANMPFKSLEAPKDPVARMSGTLSQACFVLVSGDVECHSTDGVLRPPFGKPVRTAACAGDAICATAVDGSLLCQRYEWPGGGYRNVAGREREATYEARVREVGGRVRAIAASTYRFCALRDDDAVYCWDGYSGSPVERIALPATT